MGYASRSLRRAALLGLLLSSLAQVVRADGVRILIENAEPELVRAARAAFASSAELRVAQDARLASLRGVESQAVRARELAREERVEIVVWWTGSELHTYDGRADRLLGSRRASLPISSVSAAALVLSIKAQLQAAPTEQQAGASVQRSRRSFDEPSQQPGEPPTATTQQPEPAPSSEPPAAPAPGVVQPAARAERGTSATARTSSLEQPAARAERRPGSEQQTGRAERARGLEQPAARAEPGTSGAARAPGSGQPAMRAERVLESELPSAERASQQDSLGDVPPIAAEAPLRAARQPNLVMALQAGLASLQREPVAVLGLTAAGWLGASPIGLAVRLESGPGATVRATAVQAQLLDASLAADFVVRAPMWQALRLWGGFGPRLHATWLEGTVGVSLDTKRIVPAVGGSVHLDCELTRRWYVGAWASLGWLLIAQRYYLDGVLLHESSRQRAAFGLAVGVAFDQPRSEAMSITKR